MGEGAGYLYDLDAIDVLKDACARGLLQKVAADRYQISSSILMKKRSRKEVIIFIFSLVLSFCSFVLFADHGFLFEGWIVPLVYFLILPAAVVAFLVRFYRRYGLGEW